MQFKVPKLTAKNLIQLFPLLTLHENVTKQNHQQNQEALSIIFLLNASEQILPSRNATCTKAVTEKII